MIIMNLQLSAIILTNTLDDEIYSINRNCIQSLLDSESWEELGGLEILLIESNKEQNYSYTDKVNLIIPEESFNFNRFFNIGIEKAKGQFIALCNNDIVFSPHWFSEILKVKEQNPDFLCFSSIDRNYRGMSHDNFPDDHGCYVGWNNKSHFSPWCFVLDRAVFSVTGKLDETFNLFYADDDFLMTLRKFALDNVLVTGSRVTHLGQQVINKLNERKSYKIIYKKDYPIPDKFLKRGFSWLWDDIRFYDGFFKMLNKWGDEKTNRRINRFLERFPSLRKRSNTRYLYSKRTNRLLSILGGI